MACRCATSFVDDYVNIVRKYKSLQRPPRIILAIPAGPTERNGYGESKTQRCPPKGSTCANLVRRQALNPCDIATAGCCLIHKVCCAGDSAMGDGVGGEVGARVRRGQGGVLPELRGPGDDARGPRLAQPCLARGLPHPRIVATVAPYNCESKVLTFPLRACAQTCSHDVLTRSTCAGGQADGRVGGARSVGVAERHGDGPSRLPLRSAAGALAASRRPFLRD